MSLRNIDILGKLLREKELGTVFESIELSGEIKYQESKILPSGGVAAERSPYDLTGGWQGTMSIDDDAYDCTLHLVQKEDILSGMMTVSYVEDGELTVVQEIMTGQIVGNVVNLYGVSYSYILQGQSPGYELDSFSGKISAKGNAISGTSSRKKSKRQ